MGIIDSWRNSDNLKKNVNMPDVINRWSLNLSRHKLDFEK